MVNLKRPLTHPDPQIFVIDCEADSGSVYVALYPTAGIHRAARFDARELLKNSRILACMPPEHVEKVSAIATGLK